MLDPSPASLSARRARLQEQDRPMRQMLLGVVLAFALVSTLALGALVLGTAVWLIF